MADLDCWYAVERRNLTFLKSVSPDKRMRDICTTATKTLSEIDVELRCLHSLAFLSFIKISK